MNSPQITKLSSSTSIYTYSVEDQSTELLLFLDHDWAQKHQREIRQYFINYVNDSESNSVLDKLTNAVLQLDESNGNSVIGMAKQDKTVYVSTRGRADLWLIREGKIVKLLSSVSSQTKVSGWMKSEDLFLGLLNDEGESPAKQFSSIESRLSDQIEVEEAANLIKSMGFEGIGGVVSFQQKGNLDSDLEPARVEPASVVTKGASESQTEMVNREPRKNHFSIFNRAKLWVKLTIFSKLAFPFNLISKFFPSREAIYAIETRKVSQAMRSKNRKLLLSLAVVMLIGLSVSISFGVKQRRQEEWQTKFGELIEEARFKLTEGKNLAELNPDRARDLAGEAGGLVNKLEERGLAAEQLAGLKQQLGDVLGLASGTHEVESKVWLSLGLVRSNMRGDDIRVFGDQLAVLDKGEDRAVVIGLEDKSAKVIAGKSQLNDARQIAKYSSNVYVLTDNGVVELSESGDKVIIPPDDEWGKAADMELFAGNIYLATSTGVWKYPVIEAGFGSRQSWLAEDTEIVENATAMVIDGFVWIAEGGEIHKFAQGVKDSFNISGLEDGFSNINSLYADEDTRLIYVLEAGKQRIVALDKSSGKYKQQYLAPEFNDASGMVVREEDDQMLVLAGDKILEVRLR